MLSKRSIPLDVAGARRPSEMSIFQISSSHSKKYPKLEDDEAQSIEKKPRKSNRRESLAASEFSMGSPSYGSFTTYERIPAKHVSVFNLVYFIFFEHKQSFLNSQIYSLTYIFSL